jgi:hypothetical protein
MFGFLSTCVDLQDNFLEGIRQGGEFTDELALAVLTEEEKVSPSFFTHFSQVLNACRRPVNSDKNA